ncbi:MAG TPA: PDZ domain-containing protein [Planctomycetota bacterium]
MRACLLMLASGLLAAPQAAQDPVDRLIEDLGASDEKTRERAGQELKLRGEDAIPRLKKAAMNSDAECALRARALLLDARPETARTPAPRVRLSYQEWEKGVEFQLTPDGGVAVTLPQINEETGKREFRTYRAASLDEFKSKNPELSKKLRIDRFLRPPEISPESRRRSNETWTWLGIEDPGETSTGNAEHDEFLKALDTWYTHHRRLFVQTLRDESRAEEERLKNGDDTPRLGVLVGAVGPALQVHLSLPEDQGILVVAVLENSLADQARLKRFDILLSFDGTPLPSEEDLRTVVENAFKKAEFPIELIRDGKRQTLTVQPKR